MRKNLPVISGPGLLVAAALLAGCVEGPSPAMREKIRSAWEHPLGYAGPDVVTVPLSRAKDNKLYFPLKVNGHDLKVAIDTGSRTIFDLPTMRTFGLTGYLTTGNYWGFGGYVSVHAGYVDEIDLGGLKIVGVSVVMADLSELKESQEREALPLIDGLVGADLLSSLSARIDYDALTLTLRKPPAPPTKNASPNQP
jgi:hypothetical protein